MFEYADHDPAINHTLVTHYCQQLTFTVLHLSKLDGVAPIVADHPGCNFIILPDATAPSARMQLYHFTLTIVQ